MRKLTRTESNCWIALAVPNISQEEAVGWWKSALSPMNLLPYLEREKCLAQMWVIVGSAVSNTRVIWRTRFLTCHCCLQVVKGIWKYIREHNLQDPSNKRLIKCDAALAHLLKTDATDMFQLNKLLTVHIKSLPSEDGECYAFPCFRCSFCQRVYVLSSSFRFSLFSFSFSVAMLVQGKNLYPRSQRWKASQVSRVVAFLSRCQFPMRWGHSLAVRNQVFLDVKLWRGCGPTSKRRIFRYAWVFILRWCFCCNLQLASIQTLRIYECSPFTCRIQLTNDAFSATSHCRSCLGLKALRDLSWQSCYLHIWGREWMYLHIMVQSITGQKKSWALTIRNSICFMWPSSMTACKALYSCKVCSAYYALWVYTAYMLDSNAYQLLVSSVPHVAYGMLHVQCLLHCVQSFHYLT